MVEYRASRLNVAAAETVQCWARRTKIMRETRAKVEQKRRRESVAALRREREAAYREAEMKRQKEKIASYHMKGGRIIFTVSAVALAFVAITNSKSPVHLRSAKSPIHARDPGELVRKHSVNDTRSYAGRRKNIYENAFESVREAVESYNRYGYV